MWWAGRHVCCAVFRVPLSRCECYKTKRDETLQTKRATSLLYIFLYKSDWKSISKQNFFERERVWKHIYCWKSGFHLHHFHSRTNVGQEAWQVGSTHSRQKLEAIKNMNSCLPVSSSLLYAQMILIIYNRHGILYTFYLSSPTPYILAVTTHCIESRFWTCIAWRD